MPETSAAAVHQTFTTSDPALAHEHVEKTFASHEMRLAGNDQVRFRLDTAITKSVTVGRMSYGTHARIVGPPMLDCYHVNLLVSGRCTVEHDGHRASFSATDGQSGVVFGPQAPVFIDWSADSAQYHLKLPKTSFEEHAARLAGHKSPSAIDFDLTFSLRSPAGKALCSAVAFYYSQLAADGGLSAMPVVQRELESALMTQLLVVARSNLTPDLMREGPRRPDRAIRDAIDHIEKNPHDDLSVSALAELAGLSARRLQMGFQQSTGMTPTEFVRATRLDAARRDLLSQNDDSVSDIAHRWHFTHLGRFAQQYCRRFGEKPSETLRQIRIPSVR
ncbi:AraC-like ligand-binding domain-containing protein [Gordonia sp. NPDC003424]